MLTFLTLLACSVPGHAPDPGSHPHAAHEGEHDAHGATMHHRFDDPEKWAKVFDDPARDQWQQPTAVVGALGLAPGDIVADIGAGTGYFNPYLARAVGPGGKVIAVDIEPSLVAHMAKRAETEGTPQVEPRLGRPDHPGLGPAEVDVAMMVDVYHHIDDRLTYFRSLKTALKPGGRLVVVDFKKDPAVEHGPPVEHRLARDAVSAELEQAGWSVTEKVGLLQAQYVLVATPQ